MTVLMLRSHTFALVLLLMAVDAPLAASQTDDPAHPRVVVIQPVGDQMAYATTEVTAKAGETLTLVMDNTATAPAMHHNITVLDVAVGDDSTIEQVAMAAMEAGESSGWIPAHDAILASTPMAAPGERTEVTFTVPPPGRYPYVCLYPGHFVLMRGVLRVTP